MKDKNILTFLNSLKFRLIFLTLYILANMENFSYCSQCSKDNAITNKACFNDVLTFNNKKYRAGHFVTYKNGDMIVEFSDDGGSTDGFSRIFYGLKKDGRYYFPNNSPTYEITNIGNIDDARGRYESLNLLVVSENDLKSGHELLLSPSSYDSVTELYII